MASKSAKEMTTNYSDVNVSRLSFTDLEDNQRSKGQKIAYPRYDHDQNGSDSPLFVQFPWLSLNQYGIPRIGEYYTDDSQRGFVKLPLDQSIPEVKEFSELLQSIDKRLGSDEFKEKCFGSKASKYQYQPIFRMPQEEDEDSKKDPNKKDYGPKLPYMKLKIDTTFPDNKVKSIVFTSVPGVNGKRVRTKVDGISTIDDISSYICFLSKVRPIGRPVKLWAQAPNKKDPTYGLTFKMAKVEVEPPVKSSSNVKEYLESDAFLDSDDESDAIETVKSVAIETVKSVAIETVKSVTKPTTGSTSATSTSSTASKTKQVAQVDSESDQESDEESDEEEKSVTKPTAKVQAKKVVEESDEESEDEEVKPAKKPVAKNTKTAVKTKKATV